MSIVYGLEIVCEEDADRNAIPSPSVDKDGSKSKMEDGELKLGESEPWQMLKPGVTVDEGAMNEGNYLLLKINNLQMGEDESRWGKTTQ